MAGYPNPLSFDHENARAFREAVGQGMKAQMKQEQGLYWQRPHDSFTDLTLQRIMDRLDGIERSLARLERNTERNTKP